MSVRSGADRQARTVNSALWAAYGDALGFMTELARSSSDVRRRTGQETVTVPLSWERLVGGRGGAIVSLPAGTYSDDTQLRLATARCITHLGFDVEVFAKIELPVWLSYSLGGGRGTKAAASALARSNATWCTNFYDGDTGPYTSGGGNGGAMRIQPHVWASPREAKAVLLYEVIRNTACTHGHPTGLIGSAFHALALLKALDDGEVPTPEDWLGLVNDLRDFSDIVERDEQLVSMWLPMWQGQSSTNFRDAAEASWTELQSAVLECLDDLDETERSYSSLLKRLDATNPQRRGSAILTSVLALVLAWWHRDDPGRALIESANALGSDTDTIATMAGALLGACSSSPPPGPVQDEGYIAHTARRLVTVAEGGQVKPFPYPDLLYWSAPKTQSDAVGEFQDGIAVAGLGPAEPFGKATSGKGAAADWQWLRLRFGQTVLAKQRRKLPTLDESLIPVLRPLSPEQLALPDTPAPAQATSRPRGRKGTSASERHAGALTVDEALTIAKTRQYSDAVVGGLLAQLATGPDGVDRAVLFAGLVARELANRSRR